MIAEISVFSFFLNTDSDEANVMSSGRLFQSFGPAEANERSPTVTRRDGRTSSWLESPTVDNDEMASRQRGEEGQTGIEVQCHAELGICNVM